MLLLQEGMGPRELLPRKGYVHYIEVLSNGEEDDLDLDLGMGMLDQMEIPKAEASLGT